MWQCYHIFRSFCIHFCGPFFRRTGSVVLPVKVPSYYILSPSFLFFAWTSAKIQQLAAGILILNGKGRWLLSLGLPASNASSPYHSLYQHDSDILSIWQIGQGFSSWVRIECAKNTSKHTENVSTFPLFQLHFYLVAKSFEVHKLHAIQVFLSLPIPLSLLLVIWHLQ